MLNRNIDSIIYQSYLKLGEYAHEISENIESGIEGTREQDALWYRAIYISELLDTINDHIEVKNNKVYRLIGISEQEANKILDCLLESTKISNFPVAPFIPGNVTQIITGAANQGIPGQNGQNAYIAVGFAESNAGLNFTTTPNVNTTYIAFKASNAPIAVVAASFVGLWINTKGNGGTNGSNGTNGTNGTSIYSYIRYASDTSGTGFSATPSLSLKYVAFLLSSTNLGPTPDVSLFTGLWVKFIGIDGTNGTNGNTVICGTGAPSNGIGVNGDTYLDTLNYIIYTPKSGGVWPIGHSIIGPAGTTGDPGANGNNGADGLNGVDGVATYLYIAYADSITGSNYSLVQSTDITTILAPFDPQKEFMGVIMSSLPIGATISASNFIGKWARYKGDGDKWATFSTTSLTIGTGSYLLLVEKGLAYTTGQQIVIAVDGVPADRMEGRVVNYNAFTGQLSADIAASGGSGTFSSWDVNLQAGIISPPANIYGGASPTNIDWGALPSGSAILGDTYDSIIERATQFYYLPTFSAFAITGVSSPKEVGETISGTKIWTWATTNTGNIAAAAAGNLIIKDMTTGPTTIGDSLVNDGTEALAIGTITKTVQASNTWRIAGINTHAGTFQRDLQIDWFWMKYIGTSTNVTLNATQIAALASTTLSGTINGIYSLAAGGYKYFVWDDSLGSPSSFTGFRDVSTNLAVDMADVTDNAAYSNIQNGWSYALVSVINAQGITSNKRVYRTRNILGGAINIQVS